MSPQGSPEVGHKWVPSAHSQATLVPGPEVAVGCTALPMPTLHPPIPVPYLPCRAGHR